MKKLLLALALLATSTTAVAENRKHKHHQDRVIVQVVRPYNYGYHQQQYSYPEYHYNRYGHQYYTTGYFGPIWPRSDGYYNCRSAYGNFGILTDRRGRLVNRYDITYRQLSRHKLRCR